MKRFLDKRNAVMPAAWGWNSRAALACGFLFVAAPPVALADITNTVTVTGTFGGNPVPGSASEAVSVEAANATLFVEKTGTLNDDDGVAGDSPGDTIDWSILVRNDGNVTINAITVTDPLGTPVCPASGDETIATLAPSGSETCTLSYTTTQADFDTNGGGDGDIDNTATANGTALGGIGAVSGSGSGAVPIAVTSSVSIVKTATPDTLVPAGTIITYTFDVTNTGNQMLSAVIVTDTLHNGTGSPLPAPDADTGSIITDAGIPGDSTNSTTGDGQWDLLGPGDTLRVIATYTVTQTDVDTLQ